MSEMGKKVTLVVGAGPGTGAAISERFARAGHVVVVTRRRGDETLGGTVVMAIVGEEGR